MLAASYWSLLAPAIEQAEEDGYDSLSWVPAATGFLLGAGFVSAGDRMLPDSQVSLLMATISKNTMASPAANPEDPDEGKDGDKMDLYETSESNIRKRSTKKAGGVRKDPPPLDIEQAEKTVSSKRLQARTVRRALMLVLAVTIHNFPEGMAVGFGFGAVNKPSASAKSFEKAVSLAIGIGIQNFPEGFAVSMPLYRQGMSKWRAFWYGQLSGMVEPIAGVVGYIAVSTVQILLPYALSFAAGAMIFVVVNDLIPEAHATHNEGGDNSGIISWGAMIGFVVMMVLDVALG